MEMQDCTSFLSFVQISVAFDFGLMYLSQSDVLKQMKDDMIRTIMENHRAEIKKAANACRRVRPNMTDTILAYHHQLSAHYTAYRKQTAYEEETVFMPGVAVTAGIHGLFFLLLIPLYANQWETAFSLLTYLTQAVIISQALSVSSAIIYMKLRETWHNIVYAVCSVIIIMLVAVVAHKLHLIWHCLNQEYVFFAALLVPYIPIVLYVFRLIAVFYRRRNWIRKIKKETEILEMYLDERRNAKK